MAGENGEDGRFEVGGGEHLDGGTDDVALAVDHHGDRMGSQEEEDDGMVQGEVIGERPVLVVASQVDSAFSLLLLFLFLGGIEEGGVLLLLHDLVHLGQLVLVEPTEMHAIDVAPVGLVELDARHLEHQIDVLTERLSRPRVLEASIQFG